jgi:hypothetical protein
MEPPASPRKPRQPKETPDSSGESKEDQAAAKPAPKPRPRKATPPVSPPEPGRAEPLDAADRTPILKSPLPTPEARAGQPPEKAPESRVAAGAPPVPAKKPAEGAPVRVSMPAAGKRVVTLLRTLSLRNIEVGRKYSSRAGQALRRFGGNVSKWVSSAWKRVTSARIGGKTVGQILRQVGTFIRQEPGILLDRLQHSLERSDVAVILFSLFLVVACVLVTLLVAYLWRRY